MGIVQVPTRPSRPIPTPRKYARQRTDITNTITITNESFQSSGLSYAEDKEEQNKSNNGLMMLRHLSILQASSCLIPKLAVASAKPIALAAYSFTTTSPALAGRALPPRPKPPPESEIEESFLKGSGPGGQKIVRSFFPHFSPGCCLLPQCLVTPLPLIYIYYTYGN